ncbi:hypothetical protein [Anabaena sp. CCY 0017]|uniref:hypothetical protein n=1 Tax=Anabaena sp. CCY 0017 TaxID=3103866 RepID=UPI0039C74E48
MIKQYLQLPKNLLLLFTPLLASAFLATAPSLAATLAISNSQLDFTNFSQSPTDIFVNTEVDGMVLNKGGNVFVESDPKAFFGTTPLEASSITSSLGWGENQSYLGFAESEATIKGLFNIKKNSSFSFNFGSNLTLFTSVDNFEIESAKASGKIFFALFDIINNILLTSFSLTGDLTTKANNDLIKYEAIGHVTLRENSFVNSVLGAKEELSIASFNGSIEHFFTYETTLTLIGFNQSQVQVKATVDEPSSRFALILSCALISVALKRKGQYINYLR